MLASIRAICSFAPTDSFTISGKLFLKFCKRLLRNYYIAIATFDVG
jgi:hypothetical protein